MPKLSRNNLNSPEAIYISFYYLNNLKPSILSVCDFQCPDKIGLFKLAIYIIRAKIFRTRKNFPVSNADALTRFLALWVTPPESVSLTVSSQFFLMTFLNPCGRFEFKSNSFWIYFRFSPMFYLWRSTTVAFTSGLQQSTNWSKIEVKFNLDSI